MGKVCFGWVAYPGAWGWPPVLFAAAVGVACEVASRTLSPKDPNGKPLLPGVVVSMIVGGLILNTPVGRWIGLRDAEPGHPLARLKWSEGLSFIDKTLLRLAVILLGFNIPPLFRGGSSSGELAVGVACIIVPTVQLVAFFAVQGTSRILGMDREARDMMSVGTMICGASAINAYSASLQPADGEGEEALRKSRAERISSATALSISSIFCMSLLSLLAFRPIATLLHVSDQNGGLWAGLAVGDLSSSVAVGSQFGERGEVFASISKACRILTLAPLLVLFGLRNAYSQRKGQKSSFWQTLWANFPLFMVGLLATLALRVLLDAAAPEQAATTERIGAVFSTINKGLFVSVTAAIGLRIKVATLLQSWRFLASGLAGCVSISATSLAMVQLALGGAAGAASDEDMLGCLWKSVAVGLAAASLAGTFFLVCRWLKPEDATAFADSATGQRCGDNRLPTVGLGGSEGACAGRQAALKIPEGGADLGAAGALPSPSPEASTDVEAGDGESAASQESTLGLELSGVQLSTV